MSSPEVWTIGRLLTWTTDFLKQNGADSPRLDAEVLLAHVRGCKRIELYTAFEETASDAVRSSFRELVKRRAQGTPVAYLVGQREFYSLPFFVDASVLIPRPETELLVIEVLDILKQSKPHAAEQWNIADMGTGSGIIAVCLAKSLPAAKITAIDVSPAALAIARRNVSHHQVDGNVQLVHSNLFAEIPNGPTFDLIASNPPYVKTSELAELSRDVREFEPHLALVAGPTGLEVFEPLIRQSAERLHAGGWLVLEIHPQLVDELKSQFARAGGWESVEAVRDLSGRFRIIKARRAG